MDIQIVKLKNSEWSRGERILYDDDGRCFSDENFLYTGEEENTYCCLGVLCRDLYGVHRLDMEYVSTPHRVPARYTLPEWLRVRASSFIDVSVPLWSEKRFEAMDNLIDVNDCCLSQLTDEQRVMSLNRILEIYEIPIRFEYLENE